MKTTLPVIALLLLVACGSQGAVDSHEEDPLSRLFSDVYAEEEDRTLALTRRLNELESTVKWQHRQIEIVIEELRELKRTMEIERRSYKPLTEQDVRRLIDEDKRIEQNMNNPYRR